MGTRLVPTRFGEYGDDLVYIDPICVLREVLNPFRCIITKIVMVETRPHLLQLRMD